MVQCGCSYADLHRRRFNCRGRRRASSVLGSIWVPKLRFLAGGVGAGLTFAAISNTCAMGNMLMKLPYNRGSASDIEQAITRLRG